MNLQVRKYFWLTIWILILLSGPLTVLINTPVSKIGNDPVNLLNFFQRITGLTLFTLLFSQIMLGSLMSRWVQIVGATAYKIHITEGILIFCLILVHPLFEAAIVYKLSSSLVDSALVIVPKLTTQREVYLTYARISLVLLFLTITAAYFRTKPFFRRHWQKIHVINYGIFYLIYLHMRVGTDIMNPPFLWISWIALAGVSISLALRLKNAFFSYKKG